MAFLKFAVLLAVFVFVLSSAEDLKAEATDYGYPRPGYGPQKGSSYGYPKSEHGHGPTNPGYEPYDKPEYGQAPYEHGQKPQGGPPAYGSEYHGQNTGPNYGKKPSNYGSYSSY